MKSSLILLQIYVLLIAVTIIQQNAFSQLPMNPPQVAWRQIDWDRDNLIGQEVTQENSGEDWWLSGKAVYDAGNNLIGYIACGYTNNLVTTANVVPYKIVTRPSNNCGVNVPYSFTIADNAPNNFAKGDCADRELPGFRRKGENRGQVTFMDIYGNMKWCNPVFQGEMIEVIPVSDGFICIGQTYGIRTTWGFPQYYNPTSTFQQVFSNAAICANGGTQHLGIVKLDFDGNEVWSNIYGMKDFVSNSTADLTDQFSTSGSYGNDIILNSAGNLVATGWATDNITGKLSLFLLELNPTNGYVLKRKTLFYDNLNPSPFNNLPSSRMMGTTITQIGITQTYIVGGRIYYVDELNIPNTFFPSHHLPFLAKVDGDFMGTGNFGFSSDWAPQVLYLTASESLLNPRNGTISDIYYEPSNSSVYAPAWQHCPRCESGNTDNRGKFMLYKANVNTGLYSAFELENEVRGFDPRAGITPTTDGKLAVVSTIRNAIYDYTAPDFVDAVNNSGLSSCLSTIQYDASSHYDSDGIIKKVELNGSVIWSLQFDAEGNPNRLRKPYPKDFKRQECVYRIVNTPDNGLTVFGNTSHNFDDYYMAKIFSDCQANYPDYNTFDNGDNVIDIFGAAPPWNTQRKVIGIVRIHPGATLTIDNTTIEFADVARTGIQTKIEVMAGGKLVIQNGAILTSLQGCDQAMWGGIEVEGDIFGLSQTPNSNQGWVVISSNSQVNRAYNAVSTTARDDNGNIEWNKTGGGILQVTNSSFTDNARAFEFRGYSNTNALGNPVNDKSYILQNSFYTTGAFGNLGYQRDPYTFI